MSLVEFNIVTIRNLIIKLITIHCSNIIKKIKFTNSMIGDNNERILVVKSLQEMDSNYSLHMSSKYHNSTIILDY